MIMTSYVLYRTFAKAKGMAAADDQHQQLKNKAEPAVRSLTDSLVDSSFPLQLVSHNHATDPWLYSEVYRVFSQWQPG